MITIGVIGVTVIPGGAVTVTWLDGSSTDFGSLAELSDYVVGVETEETARRLLLAYALARSPTMEDADDIVVGSEFTIDMSSQQPFQLV